jgi:hypothetical protein
MPDFRGMGNSKFAKYGKHGVNEKPGEEWKAIQLEIKMKPPAFLEK